jgi:regulatory protein
MGSDHDNSQSYKAQLERARCWCATEERCESGVRDKLVAWGASAGDTDEIVAALREEGYLDEVRYARAYCESKVLHQHWGRQKVLYQLRLKRLPREAIEEGMAAVDEEQYMEMLKETVERKLRELSGKREEESGKLDVTEKRKLMAFLASRGFSMSEINEVITKITKP